MGNALMMGSATVVHDQEYLDVIEEVRQEFVDLLKGHPPIELSAEELEVGVAALPSDLQEMNYRVHDKFIGTRGRRLTYNQICLGFFSAANGLSLIQIRPSRN